MMEKKLMQYQQRSLNFEAPLNAEGQHVAEKTSTPPPEPHEPQTTPATDITTDTPLEPIRLACLYCDRGDYDHVEELPGDWHEIHDVQTYAESLRPASLADISVLDWFTHVGVCPDCHHALDGPTTDEKSPPLVCPDRQLTYGGSDPSEWPHVSTVHDVNTISVDRLTTDIDGPPHRFLICRGDQVDVYFAPEKFVVGEVVEIDHTREEVQVQFPESLQCNWFYKRRIYPVGFADDAEPPPEALPAVLPSAADDTPPGVRPEQQPITPTAPYTFAEFAIFHERFTAGAAPFAEWRTVCDRMWQSEQAMRTELLATRKAKELVSLAQRMGIWHAKRATKDDNATRIVKKMLSALLPNGQVSYQPLRETYEQALRRKLTSLTEGEYYRHFVEEQVKVSAQERALADPQNLADFHLFIEAKGEDALTDEQLARYDAQRADLQRGLRAEQNANSTVQKFQGAELQTLSFARREGYHEKRQCPLHIVQLESRVERDAFNELNRKAKQLGGWYSSFKQTDAGFQFLEASQADRFCELLTGDVNRADVLTARKERKELSAAERLHELATELNQRAEETIERSHESLQNTTRRADIQAGVRGRAYADQALSRTLHSIAEALSRGEAKYLDGLRHKTHVETLETVLHLAKWARLRAVKKLESESSYQHGERERRVDEEPISLTIVRFVDFPYPTVYRRHLAEAIQQGKLTKGVKKSADALRKHVSATTADYIEFTREYELKALTEFVDRAKVARIDVERITQSLQHYQRLVRANITCLPELRAALREYLPHRAERRGDDPVKIAERELIGKELPGFFPTPRPVIARMLELVQIEHQHRVLEPSCGKGDILDVLREKFPELELHAIERNYTLAEVLSAKGHEVEFADFLDHQGSYDRILMNPPFENSQDAEHVQHAYTLLAPGGRLVSVMCEGPFFRSDVKSVAFRDWLEAVGGETEELPADAFQGKDAFRQTGVRTRLVTISKKAHA